MFEIVLSQDYEDKFDELRQVERVEKTRYNADGTTVLSASSASANGEENVDDDDQFVGTVGTENKNAKKRRNSAKAPRSTRLSILHSINEKPEDDNYDFEQVLDNLLNKRLEVRPKLKIKNLTPRNRTEKYVERP